MMHRIMPATAVASRHLGTLLASVGFFAMVGSATAGNIADTVRAAVKTNPDIGIVKNDRLAVDQELRQARAGYLPTLDLRAAAGPRIDNNNDTRLRGPGSTNTEEAGGGQASLTLSQMLFDGYATRSEVARQAARVDSASYRVNEAAEFIAVDAIEGHLDVLRNQEILKLNEANVAEHERLLRNVRDLERNGRVDISDVRQAEARLAAARASLATGKQVLRDAIALYERVVGIKPSTLVLDVPPVASLPKDSEAAASLASVQSPTVLIAASDIDVTTAELKGSRAGYYPRLDLQLDAVQGQDVNGNEGQSSSASAQVVLRYNLFRGGADLAREREAFHRANEARSGLVKARRKAEEEARVSISAYESAKERVVAQRARAVAQEQTRNAYRSQFEIGQRDLLDLLDAENELFLAKVQLITAEYTERFAVYRALGVVGTLLDTLQIARPKEEININRTPEAVQSPTVIDEKSKQVLEPKASPRPLRGAPAGEPPLAVEDSADGINIPLGGNKAAAAPASAPATIQPAAGPTPLTPATTGPGGTTGEAESAEPSNLAIFMQSLRKTFGKE